MNLLEVYTKPYIRWLIKRDFPEVLDIDKNCFKKRWSEQKFTQALRDRYIIGMVVEYGQDVVGFMIYKLEKNRLFLIRMAVHPKFQKRGLGRAMIEKLKGKLSGNGRNRLTAVSKDDMLSEHLWLKACGFRATQIKDNRYKFVYQTENPYDDF